MNLNRIHMKFLKSPIDRIHMKFLKSPIEFESFLKIAQGCVFYGKNTSAGRGREQKIEI